MQPLDAIFRSHYTPRGLYEAVLTCVTTVTTCALALREIGSEEDAYAAVNPRPSIFRHSGSIDIHAQYER